MYGLLILEVEAHGWAWTFFKDLAREEKMSGHY